MNPNSTGVPWGKSGRKPALTRSGSRGSFLEHQPSNLSVVSAHPREPEYPLVADIPFNACRGLQALAASPPAEDLARASERSGNAPIVHTEQINGSPTS